MARHYHVDIAQYAASADQKWVDNLLSHFEVPGVERAHRGVARRISALGVYHIALTRQLTQELGVGLARAVSLAGQLLAPNATRVPILIGLELRFERAAFEEDVDRRIADAVESVTPARRGRPPERSRD